MEELARCEHAVVVRTLRVRDVVREYWRLLRGRPGLRPEECTGPLVCQRCGVTVPEGGSSRARPPLVWMGVGLLAAAGCSHGLQETAFKNEHGVFIVSQSLVNDRMTATQPHLSGELACSYKHTPQQMRDLRTDGEAHSWYYGCQRLEDYKSGLYHKTHDQAVGTIYKGPVEAAIVGAAVGTGLALSGTEVVQQGGGASASARSQSVGGRTGRRH